jgi:ATP-dependent exoDNAse (exonuclease V) beta subunit
MKTLHEIISEQTRTKYATKCGTDMHTQLQRITIDETGDAGNPDLINKIKSNPQLVRFFSAQSKTEVPIAGTIKNKFISRRIDRLCIDKQKKHIDIIDYKTDTAPDAYRAKYIAQIKEYAELLSAIYLDFSIDGYILWTHDFSLEQVANKQV